MLPGLLISLAMTASFVLSPVPAPSTLVRAPQRLRALLELEPQPPDELRRRFTRGDEEDQMEMAFTPASMRKAETVAAADARTANEQLLAEIRALQPEPAAPPPERKAVDLNGIRPENLLLGAASYGVVSVLAWQFTGSAGEFFADHPMDTAFYVVARLSGLARVVVVGMGALGAGVTCIASLGQLALAVQVAIGIQKGELDPKAERVDPYGGRKQGELEKMLGLMKGDKRSGL